MRKSRVLRLFNDPESQKAGSALADEIIAEARARTKETMDRKGVARDRRKPLRHMRR